MDFNNTKEKVNLRNKQFSLNGKFNTNNSKTDKQTMRIIINLELSQRMINLLYESTMKWENKFKNIFHMKCVLILDFLMEKMEKL
jgi:hypothetical protein